MLIHACYPSSIACTRQSCALILSFLRSPFRGWNGLDQTLFCTQTDPLLVRLSVRVVQMSSLRVCRTWWVRVREERLNRSQNGTDGVNRGPLLPNNVQAQIPISVNWGNKDRLEQEYEEVIQIRNNGQVNRFAQELESYHSDGRLRMWTSHAEVFLDSSH